MEPSSGLLGLSMCRQPGGCLWPPPQPTCILPILKAAFPSLPTAKVSEYFRLVEFTWQLGTWELTSFSFRCHRNILFLLSLIKSLIMITIFCKCLECQKYWKAFYLGHSGSASWANSTLYYTISSFRPQPPEPLSEAQANGAHTPFLCMVFPYCSADRYTSSSWRLLEAKGFYLHSLCNHVETLLN